MYKLKNIKAFRKNLSFFYRSKASFLFFDNAEYHKVHMGTSIDCTEEIFFLIRVIGLRT